MKTVFNKLIDVSLNITDGVHNTVVDDVDGDCFLLSAKNIKNGLVNFDNNDRRINDAVRAKLNKRTQMSVGDVLFTTVGTLGETALADTNCNKYEFQRSVAIIKPNKEIIDSRYLYYLLKSNSYNYYFKSIATGAAQPCIFIGNLAKTKIKYFEDIAYQRQIADILSAYDEFIENNNKRIKLLEQMAENLYKEWFVRFRFPNHENTEFENGIPKGWEIKRMNEFCYVTDGTHDSPKPCDDGMPLITGKCISNGFIDFNEAYLISAKDHEKIKKRSGLSTGDILFSNIGTVGNCCIVRYNQEFSVKNVIIFKPENMIKTAYLYYWMTSPAMQEIFSTQTNGASQQFVGLTFMRQYKLLVPNEEILNSFGESILPIIDLKEKIHTQNINLIKQRDLLLPRLMSGKLEV